jgi:hypothetical protein
MRTGPGFDEQSVLALVNQLHDANPAKRTFTLADVAEALYGPGSAAIAQEALVAPAGQAVSQPAMPAWMEVLNNILNKLGHEGGGVAYSSGYGCVDSSSQPLVAEEGTETVQGPDGLDHGYTWSIGYYRLLDLQWTHVATRTGKAAFVRTHPPSDGSNCSNPDPAHRGPEIGMP